MIAFPQKEEERFRTNRVFEPGDSLSPDTLTLPIFAAWVFSGVSKLFLRSRVVAVTAKRIFLQAVAAVLFGPVQARECQALRA
jgi:hypothetical protein